MITKKIAVRDELGRHIVWLNVLFLEIEVETDAESVVLAVVVVGLEEVGTHRCFDVAAVIEGTHIAEVDIEVLRRMDAHTTANHVVREVERKVAHELIV